jgi:hypothetical protein
VTHSVSRRKRVTDFSSNSPFAMLLFHSLILRTIAACVAVTPDPAVGSMDLSNGECVVVTSCSLHAIGLGALRLQDMTSTSTLSHLTFTACRVIIRDDGAIWAVSAPACSSIFVRQSAWAVSAILLTSARHLRTFTRSRHSNALLWERPTRVTRRFIWTWPRAAWGLM